MVVIRWEVGSLVRSTTKAQADLGPVRQTLTGQITETHNFCRGRYETSRYVFTFLIKLIMEFALKWQMFKIICNLI